jgi:hypothetical protein
MSKLNRHANHAVLTVLVAVLLTAQTATARVRDRAADDRGDVPGWAIASGAACVLALLVYTAYSGVINSWTAKIH